MTSGLNLKVAFAAAVAFALAVASCATREFGDESETKRVPTESFALVSDVDDTIKITHIESRIDAILNGLNGKDAFAGMAELFGMFGPAGARPTEFFYLSGGPQQIESRAQKMLTENHFPMGRLIFRNIFTEGDILKFKLENIAEIASSTRDSVMYFFGDDTQKDPETFLEAARRYPARAAAIYIRRNTKRPLPNGVAVFNTAYDVALREFRLGRLMLNENQIASVGEALLNERENERIIPHFSECPADYTLDMRGLSQRLVTLTQRVQDKVRGMCLPR